MFTFKATLIVSSAAEARIDKLFESLLSEQLSKRTGNDFLISFDENELKIEFYDVELTEKFAPKILGCGTVKKFIIENHAEPKNKPEKEIEAKVKAGENEHVTGSETEAENESEAKKEETESDSEDDTDANAEAGAEETEPEAEQEVIPEAEVEEGLEFEQEQEVIPEAKAEEKHEPDSEPKATSEGKAKEKSAEETSLEEFSKEYAEKLYEESENLEEFSGKLADYIQISDSRIRNAFEELIKAVAETQKMSWFCIENIIKRSSQNLCKKAEFNTNTKVLISKAVKERFNLTLLVFLKLIKELMIEVNSKAKENSEPESEPEEVPEAKAEEEPELESEPEVVSEAKAEEEPEPKSEPEVVSEAKTEEEPELESEPEVVSEAKAEEEPEPKMESEEVPEAKAEEEHEPKSESEVIPEAKAEKEPELESEQEVVPEAKSEVEPKSKPELEEPKTEAEEEPKPEPEPEVTSEAETKETFDEYWSGIFKCMPKIISTDKYRIENVSKKEQQFLAINKSNPMAFRIKEVLEIMEDISLVADPNFITLSEQIFTKVPVIKVEKSMALYEKMRLLQWSKMLQKFVQRYYTKDPNFRVRIESFLTELREIIMTPEEIAKIK